MNPNTFLLFHPYKVANFSWSSIFIFSLPLPHLHYFSFPLPSPHLFFSCPFISNVVFCPLSLSPSLSSLLFHANKVAYLSSLSIFIFSLLLLLYCFVTNPLFFPHCTHVSPPSLSSLVYVLLLSYHFLASLLVLYPPILPQSPPLILWWCLLFFHPPLSNPRLLFLFSSSFISYVLSSFFPSFF